MIERHRRNRRLGFAVIDEPYAEWHRTHLASADDARPYNSPRTFTLSRAPALARTDPLRPGCRWHGRGLSRARYETQSRRRAQSPACVLRHHPDRLRRFEREAKTLASLNHPNIAIIYGLEQADDVHALVMELVEGEALATPRTRRHATSRRPAHRAPDRGGAGSGTRAGDHPSRSEACEHQSPAGRHGEGPGLRSRQSDGAGRRVRRILAVADHHDAAHLAKATTGRR